MFEHEIGFVFYGKRLCGYMEHLFWVWSGQLSDLMSESEERLFNIVVEAQEHDANDKRLGN